MKVNTFLFGEVEVDADKVINFPNGLTAFEDKKRYMLVHEADKGAPVSFTLQSLDDPNLAFQIIDPTMLGFNYELELSDAENVLLQSPAAEDVAVMQLLSRKDGDPKGEIVPNLRAPLILNLKARIGMQKIMERMEPNLTLSNLASKV